MSQKTRDELLAKARLLKALADGVGEPHEKESAQRFFEQYCKTNKITLSEVVNNANQRTFKFKTEDECTILTNVILSVNPFTDVVPVYNGAGAAKNFVKCELDEEDFKECIEKFRHFIKLWYVEKDVLSMSFFAKHKEYFEPDEHTRKKYMGRQKTNQKYEAAKKDAADLTEKGNKPLTQADIDAMDESERIRVLNFKRMQKLAPILLDANYAPNHKTIET